MTEIEKNKQLIERYPFLLPRNRWTDKVADDYDFSYTELDAMPVGWRKAFGEQLCEEIREALIEAGCLEKYRINQIKEKFGRLCWYDAGAPEKVLKEILPKYEKMSWDTCISCGKPSTCTTTGWISPYCDDCAKVLEERFRQITKPITEQN